MKFQRRLFCVFCQCDQIFAKRPLDHRFHRAVTFLTLGLWALGWFAVCLYWMARVPGRCGFCWHRLRRLPAPGEATTPLFPGGIVYEPVLAPALPPGREASASAAS